MATENKVTTAPTTTTTTTSGKRVVLVTGANQGIGYSAVQQLSAHADLLILLGARSKANADTAVASIGKANVLPFVVDLNDDKSISEAANTIKTQYGGLDILINNAGFAWKPASQFDSEVVAATLKTNYFGTLKLTQALWPLLKPNARVVFVSSQVSRWTYHKLSPAWQAKFAAADLTIDQLTGHLNEFAASVARGTLKEDGFTDSAYGLSKIGVSALNSIFARDNKIEGAIISAVCPGWTQTYMSGGKGTKTPAQGAEVLVHCALLPAGSPSGGFWENNRQTSWTAAL